MSYLDIFECACSDNHVGKFKFRNKHMANIHEKKYTLMESRVCAYWIPMYVIIYVVNPELAGVFLIFFYVN